MRHIVSFAGDKKAQMYVTSDYTTLTHCLIVFVC